MIVQGYKDLASLPAQLRLYGASDYATMEPEKGKKEPDYTEHGVVGIDRQQNLWFIDWWFQQCETDKGIAAFIQLVQRYKPQGLTRWWHEGGLIDKAIKPAIRREMRDKAGAFITLEPMPSLDDKSVKLAAFHARASAGTVYFPIRRKWTDHVIDQLVKFPGGRWDDAADVCGLIGRGIDQMHSPGLKVEHTRPLLVPFTEKWLEYGSDPKPKVRFF